MNSQFQHQYQHQREDLFLFSLNRVFKLTTENSTLQYNSGFIARIKLYNFFCQKTA